MIERKKAPPIPYLVSLVARKDRDDQSAFGQDIRPYIEDWRLEVNFQRDVPATLWLEVKGDLPLDLQRDLVRVTGGEYTRVDITFLAVMPDRVGSKWEITFYEVDAWTRVHTRPQAIR